MGLPLQRTTLTEFLDWEEQQADRHEFYRGETFAMEGGTARHNRVILNLGAWAAEGVAAKGGPSEDSFCRVCRPIAVAMGQKAGKKWTAAAALQPTFLLPPTLLARRIGDHLEGTPCQVFAENMKVPLAEGVLYPDVVVTCGKAEAGDEQTIVDPKLVIEVLSPSTKGYDKRDKFILYRSLPSLGEYVRSTPRSGRSRPLR